MTIKAYLAFRERLGDFEGALQAFKAFLAFNREFQVLWAGKYMSEKHPQELAAFCPYNAAEARSLWMQRAGGDK